MNAQTQNENAESLMQQQEVGAILANGIGVSQVNHVEDPIVELADVARLDKANRMKLSVNELKIGQRIHEELKQQGRTVSWLARQLNMERTSLYYTFRQNSIDLELLMRISFYLEHNFLKDVVCICKRHGL